MSHSRNWCFTIFNYVLPLFTSLPEWANYLIFQEEECPTTKKRHIQGYVNLNAINDLRSCKRNCQMGLISKHAGVHHPAIEIIAERMIQESTVHGSSESLRKQGATRGRRWNVFRKTQKNLDLPTLNCIVAAWRRRLIRSSVVWYSLYLTDLGSSWLRRYWTRAQMIELSYGCMALKAMKVKPHGLRPRFSKDGSIQGEEKEKTYNTSMRSIWVTVYSTSPDRWKTIYSILYYKKLRIDYWSSKYEPIDFNCSDKVHVVVLSNFLPCLDLEYNNRGETVKKPLLSRDRVFLINIDESVCGHPDDLKSFDMYLE
ncbi:Rep protein [Papaya leaf curl alphasatellite]|uniref:Rep protein n=1 Tax=Papaya leaf curl alphasatellite TaxID=1112202 RepID=UPI0003D7CF7E|nr:Rep protein [Papaya leaf curl alphasatellite]AEW10519.1 Rep protein [Papaya leaf curl alphasatellite]